MLWVNRPGETAGFDGGFIRVGQRLNLLFGQRDSLDDLSQARLQFKAIGQRPAVLGFSQIVSHGPVEDRPKVALENSAMQRIIDQSLAVRAQKLIEYGQRLLMRS